MAKQSKLGRLARLGGLTTRLSSGYLGQRVREAFADDATRQRLRDRFQLDSAAQMVDTLGRLRGAAMKFGQSISVAVQHLDLPDEVRDTLAKLQSDGEPVPFDAIRATVERELGAPLGDVFTTFDPVPLGTASLAQAHRAVLPDGDEVVVKVLHDGVEDGLEADLFAVRALMMSARALGGRSREEMDTLFEEVRERLTEELDYLQEAANIEAMRTAFGADARVRIPRQRNALCTQRVLVLDRLPGRPLKDFLATASPAQRQAAGMNLAEAFFEMAFRHRLLHADPHPGNYLFEDDGRVGLLDFGCVKRFRVTWIGHYAQAAVGAVDGDRDAVLDACFAMGAWDGEDARAADVIWRFCDAIVGPWRGREYTVGGPEDRILERVHPLGKEVWDTPGITAPRDILFLHRTLGGVYTIGRQLGVTARWDDIVRRGVQPALDALGKV